jgi:5-methylcytosine-specific restriction enzyme A
MPRNPTWIRDELILALDLYLRLGQVGPEHPEVVALSGYLRSLPLAAAAGSPATYRNPDGVAMKLGNYAALDPNYPGVGLERGGRGDRDVWDAFAHDPAHLAAVAAAIRRAVAENRPALVESAEDEEGVPEGSLLFRQHVRRERNGSLIRRKKAEVLAATGRLACEVCGFDFGERYGAHGRGYAECHHRLPLSQAGPSRTYLKDLAIVCANCHRMLHRGDPWPSIERLRALL